MALSVDVGKSLIYLCFFSVPGVLIRIYFDVLYGIDKSSVFSITSSTGAAFETLPANGLGCFIMGFFASAVQMKMSEAGLGKDQRGQPILPAAVDVVCVPYEHPLQRRKHLWLGLRTGLCGSITTFSAWILQCTQMLCAGNYIASGFVLVIGIHVYLGSLFVGMACAQELYRWRQSKLNAPPLQQTLLSSTSDPLASEPAAPSTQDTSVLLSPASPSLPSPSSSAPPSAPAADVNKVYTTLDYVVLALFILMEALAIMGLFINTTEYQGAMRAYWLSLLMAPFGVALRWQLGVRLNGAAFLGDYKWLPLGTLAANALACLIDGACMGVLYHSQQSDWHFTALKAVIVGFNGALSTVSTFVVEVFKFQPAVPGKDSHVRAFGYATGSMALGIVLCVSTYVWST